MCFRELSRQAVLSKPNTTSGRELRKRNQRAG